MGRRVGRARVAAVPPRRSSRTGFGDVGSPSSPVHPCNWDDNFYTTPYQTRVYKILYNNNNNIVAADIGAIFELGCWVGFFFVFLFVFFVFLRGFVIVRFCRAPSRVFDFVHASRRPHVSTWPPPSVPSASTTKTPPPPSATRSPGPRPPSADRRRCRNRDTRNRRRATSRSRPRTPASGPRTPRRRRCRHRRPWRTLTRSARTAGPRSVRNNSLSGRPSTTSGTRCPDLRTRKCIQ